MVLLQRHRHILRVGMNRKSFNLVGNNNRLAMTCQRHTSNTTTTYPHTASIGIALQQQHRRVCGWSAIAGVSLDEQVNFEWHIRNFISIIHAPPPIINCDRNPLSLYWANTRCTGQDESEDLPWEIELIWPFNCHSHHHPPPTTTGWNDIWLSFRCSINWVLFALPRLN